VPDYFKRAKLSIESSNFLLCIAARPTEQNTRNNLMTRKTKVDMGILIGKVVRGSISINERYFVARFAREHRVIYELIEREFYFYVVANGAWERRTPEEVKEMFAEDWQRVGRRIQSTQTTLEAHPTIA
jgi:hypothetical protein